MADYDVSELPFRCVLPFKAQPHEIQLLRKAVTSQLARWFLPTATDEVQLAVSELATNVLQHVGEGSAGVLILEARADLLRLEMHDQSHEAPTVTRMECDDECGRGLYLLAHLADDWGTVLTASGKAVWCEFTLGFVGVSVPLRRATAALVGYTDGHRLRNGGGAERGENRGT
ncbi:ATP-binding protein [Streptomyces sp. NPDC102381]|uniref:ATP-binding protein n=1 Tax=Streptomyces sp. NPDC102381 TaxID=3366164 RepID=UPI003806997A